MQRLAGRRRVLILVLLLVPASLAWATRTFHGVTSKHWPDQYDVYFKKYTKRYFGPHFDWEWFKAQGIAESALNPKARSHVGAKGLMQIMPATYAEIRRANPHFLDIEAPRWNIAAGIYYNRGLYRDWEGMPDEDRLMMAFASYNAGLGGMRRAARRSPIQPVRRWVHVEKYAPKETRGYVKRIKALKFGEGFEDPKGRFDSDIY